VHAVQIITAADGHPLRARRHPGELYGDEWQGRNAIGTYDFTVDLGEVKSIKEIGSRWFQVRQDYAFLPEKVEYFVSNTPNAADFVQVDAITTPALSARIQAKYYRTINLDARARYVKMRVSGGTAWTMTDELEVQGQLDIAHWAGSWCPPWACPERAARQGPLSD
jgi:hypothetical protein